MSKNKKFTWGLEKKIKMVMMKKIYISEKVIQKFIKYKGN